MDHTLSNSCYYFYSCLAVSRYMESMTFKKIEEQEQQS